MGIGKEMFIESQSKDSLGWPDLSDLKGKALKVLETALDEGTPRDQMQAAAMVKGMDDSNIKVAEFEDKTARLDAGQPTQITDIGSLGEAAASLAMQLEELTKPRAVEVIEPERIEQADNDLRPD